MKNKFKILTLLALSLFLGVSCEEKADQSLPEESQSESSQEISQVSQDQDLASSIDDYLSKSDNNLGKESTTESKAEDTKSIEENKEVKTARLLFGGDILPHMPINDYAYNYGGGVYDYSRSFEDLKDFAEDYDFFMVNNEFTVNPNLEPSGFPQFNSNKEIYRALKDAGVDVMTTANNHSLDTGFEGLSSTIDLMNSYGIENTGTSNTGERSQLIYEVNGIKLGILSYAEILNGFEYMLDTEEKAKMVNMLDPDQIEEDIRNIKDQVDFLVIYPHWGIEYSSYPEQYQIDLAHDMIDWGADLVIGNHPHVIQGMEEYESQDGRDGIIYYSLGNLISNQKQAAFEGDYRVEQGLLVEAEIEKSGNKKARLVNQSYHTTCVDRSYDEFGSLLKTFVATPYLEDEEKMGAIDPGTAWLIENAKEMNKATIDAGI